MLRLSEQHDSLTFPLVFAPEFMNIDHIMSSLLRSGAQVYPHPVGSELPLSNLQAHLCPEHGYRLTLHSRSCPGKLIWPFLNAFFPSQMLSFISIISTFWEASVPYMCQKKSSDIWCSHMFFSPCHLCSHHISRH